jgi:hypothetical protein
MVVVCNWLLVKPFDRGVRMFSRVGRTCLTASAASVVVGAGGLPPKPLILLPHPR